MLNYRSEMFDHPNNPYISDGDVRLMLEFKEGNTASFEALMRKYFPRLLNFIHRYVGNREIAEELTQEVFIKVYQSVAYYEPRSQFKTWIYTIAKNMSLNELRRHKNLTVSLDEPLESSEDSLPGFARQIEDERLTRPDQEMIQKDMARVVKEAVHSLPQNQRIAIVLARYDKFSYAEIAKTMSLSVAAVKSLLSRAKENLRDKLKSFDGR